MALILFLPVLALALKLLYLWERVLYVDHLAFGATFKRALPRTGGDLGVVTFADLAFWLRLAIYALVFLVMLTIYLSRALQSAYGQRRLITALKAGALVLASMSLIQPVIGAAEDPLGRRVTLAGGPNNAPRTIVGIVGDVRHYGLHMPPAIQVYMPRAQGPWIEPSMTLVVRTRAGIDLCATRCGGLDSRNRS